MTGRRLVLVSLPWHRPKDPRAPLGHASLLASARAAGVDVVERSFPMNAPRFDAASVAEWILEQARGLHPRRVDVALGCYVWNERPVRQVLQTLRAQGFDGRLILGGPQVSYAPAGLEELYPEVDVFVRGYGEEALVSLSRSGLPRPIPGVHYAGWPDAEAQAEITLARLPSPLLSGTVPLSSAQALVRLETQRGCPFRCNFCQHREAGSRLPLRDLATDRVLAEVRLLCDLQVREVAILDPVFNMGAIHRVVLEEFERGGFEGRLSVQARLESVDDAFLHACSGLDLVPEFGLQTIHRAEMRAIDRPNAMARVDAVLERLRSLGRDFLVSIIYGLPEQTLESFRATVDHLLRAGVPTVRAFPLVLLRGTDLERRRGEWGLVEDDGVIPQVVASSTFGRAEYAQMARLADVLRATEGAHPGTVQALSRQVRSAA